MAQEKQLSEDNVINTENAGDVFQTWIEVKKKKQKRVSEGFNEECKNISDSNHFISLVNQKDYQLNGISKKKKKTATRPR